MKTIWCFLGLLITIISCTNKPVSQKNILLNTEKNKDLIVVNIDTASVIKRGLKMSSFFSTVKYIPLEVTDHSLLGMINKMLVKGDTIYILDDLIAKQVFRFHKQTGKFIGLVGRRGEGPGEYANPTDFGFINDTVYVFDYNNQEVSYYQLPDCNYLFSKTLESAPVFCRYLMPRATGFYTDMQYRGRSQREKEYLLRYFDLNNRQLNRKWLPVVSCNKGIPMDASWSGVSCFYSSQDGYRFYTGYMDTIMAIRHDTVTPYLVLQSEDLLSENEIEKCLDATKNIQRKDLYSMNKIFNIAHFVENDRYIFFTYSKGISIFTVVYDKERKNGSINEGTIWDDFLFKDRRKKVFVTPLLFEGEKGFYGYISPYEIERFESLLDNRELTGAFEKELKDKGYSLDSNPVLLYYE